DLPHQDRLQRLGVDARNMERARSSVALDHGENLVFMSCPAAFVSAAFDVAVKGFVGLDDLASSPEHPALYFHGFTDSVRHKPRRFVRHLKHTMELVTRHPFFRRAEKLSRKHPFMQGNLAALENRFHCHSKLLAAVTTEI